jgi:hypothetical protein
LAWPDGHVAADAAIIANLHTTLDVNIARAAKIQPGANLDLPATFVAGCGFDQERGPVMDPRADGAQPRRGKARDPIAEITDFEGPNAGINHLRHWIGQRGRNVNVQARKTA